MSKISIKWRITLWVTLLVLLIVLLVLGFMSAGSGAVERAEAKNRLVAVVEDNAEEIEYDDGQWEMDEDDFDFYRNGVTALVYSEQGELITGQPPRNFSPDIPLAEGEPRLLDVGSRQYYVYDLRLTFRRDPPVWIRGVLPLEAVSGAGGEIVRLAFVTLPLLVALAAVGGYFITHRAFRPMRQITRTVDSIAGGQDLSRRIDIGPGQDEVHALARTCNGMLQRLEDAFEAEGQFVSDVSHELRTPVAVILAQCEYALGADVPGEDQVEALEAVQRQAGRMSRLIGHLLAMTRLQQGTRVLALERADISALVLELCREQEALAPPGMALRAQVEPGLFARTDIALFTRLFENLVRNAFQYGGAGGPVWVRLCVDQGRGTLAIQDQGPGIAPGEQPKIWRRFYQANSSRIAEAEAGSMGLGLAMVRQIARLLGGEMDLRSAPGEGSTFIFLFPIEQISLS